MRTVTYKVDDLKKVAIHIGRAEENEATRVQIDAGSVFAEYPAAVPAMKVISPAGVTYSREVTRDGDMVVWDVVDSDLAAEGYGEMQLTFTENSVKVKSAIAQIRVCRSISGGTTPPDPVQDWLDEAEAALDAFPTGGTTGQVLAKKSNDDYDTEWVNQSSGTVDYTDLTNKPQIGGVTLTGDKSLHDLGIAAESAIPDPTSIIDDTAGDGDTNKVWSADKTDAELADVKSAIDKLTPDATASDIGKALIIKTVADGKPSSYEYGEAGGGSVDPQDIAEAVDAWCDENITNPSSPPLDRSLSSSSGAVPADIGGEMRRDLSAMYNVYIGRNLANPAKFTQGYLNSSGTITDSSSYRTTDYIPIENGKTYAIGSYSIYNVVVKGRYGYLLYNESKEPITADYDNTDNISGSTFTVSDANAKYARCFCGYASGRTIMVCEASAVPVNSVPYEETWKANLLLDETPVNQIGAMIPGFMDTTLNQYQVPIIQTSQLFDRSKVTVGYCSNTGYIDSSTSYVYTEKIPVTAGKTLYFSIDGTADSARFVCAYDANGEPVSASGSSSSVSTYTVPSGIVAVRLSYTNPASTAKYAHFQAEYDQITGYVAYGKFFNIDGYMGKDNVLYGKKWAVCGDSFTDGVLNTTIQTGKYTGHRIVYPYLIGNRNNMDIVKFFNGGQTLAFPASPGDFTNSLTNPSGTYYYQNIPADVDYITIYLGINDANHAPGGSASGEIPIGEITDDTTATYCGAWNVVLTWLITNRPHAHIGIIVTNGNSSDTYRQAQIAIAKKYGLAYIDMNGDERTPAMLRTSNPDIASAVKNVLLEKWRVSESNTHPNDDAHVFESTFIENFLRCI